MKTILAAAALLLTTLTEASAQNWAALLYQQVPLTDPNRAAGAPTNCVAQFTDIGTNAVLHAGIRGLGTNYFKFVFVGNQAAMLAFNNARQLEWNAWKSAVSDVADALAESNRVATIQSNLDDLQQLFDANASFLAFANTTNNTVGPVLLSNQTVRVSRILRRIEPLLRELYTGK